MTWVELTYGRVVNLDNVKYIDTFETGKGKTIIRFVFGENGEFLECVDDYVDTDYDVAREIVRKIVRLSELGRVFVSVKEAVRHVKKFAKGGGDE